MAKGLLRARRIAHTFLRTQLSSKSHERSTRTATSLPPLNSLSGLPAEIKQAIFSSLPDIASLKALISTCSCLYHSFYDCESSILTRVLLNQITPSLMPNAIATFKSSEMTPWTKETAENLLMPDNTGETFCGLPRWTLRNALVLSKMHEHVQFFTHRLTVDALQLHPITGLRKADQAPVSPSESRRIQRALYRFEFYCNLFAFRSRCDRGCSEIFSINFRKFAPWENEQLACICDHLNKYLLKPERVNERTKHLADSKWMNAGPEYYLAYGLEFLHRLALATTHKELNSVFPTRTRLLNSETFFISRPFSRPTLSRLNEDARRMLIPPPVNADDNDSGPKDAWYWAHAECSPMYWYNTPTRDELRRWAYVMWDSARLRDWGVLERDHRSLPRRTLDI